MDTATIIGWIVIAAVIIFLVGLAIYLIFRELSKRKAAGPSHIELYFSENFRNLIDEWDLQTRSKIKTWRGDMGKRLNAVGSDIERLKAFRQSMDTRLENLKRELVNLEKL